TDDQEDHNFFHLPLLSYLPTRCSTSWLFSLQMKSEISSFVVARVATAFVFQGFFSAPGSSTVPSISRCPKSTRRRRVIRWSCVVCGPASPSQVLSLKPIVSTTSVSPSHVPTECPVHEGSRALGCGRP